MHILPLLAIICLVLCSCKPEYERHHAYEQAAPASTRTPQKDPCEREWCMSSQTLIPADVTHCAVVCCLGEYGCRQQFIPYVNKDTGQTEGMYDVSNNKLISSLPK